MPLCQLHYSTNNANAKENPRAPSLPVASRISERPKNPMMSGDAHYQTFRINKATHPTCRLKQNTYHIFKERIGRGDLEFMARVLHSNVS